MIPNPPPGVPPHHHQQQQQQQQQQLVRRDPQRQRPGPRSRPSLSRLRSTGSPSLLGCGRRTARGWAWWLVVQGATTTARRRRIGAAIPSPRRARVQESLQWPGSELAASAPRARSRALSVGSAGQPCRTPLLRLARGPTSPVLHPWRSGEDDDSRRETAFQPRGGAGQDASTDEGAPTAVRRRDNLPAPLTRGGGRPAPPPLTDEHPAVLRDALESHPECYATPLSPSNSSAKGLPALIPPPGGGREGGLRAGARALLRGVGAPGCSAAPSPLTPRGTCSVEQEDQPATSATERQDPELTEEQLAKARKEGWNVDAAPVEVGRPPAALSAFCSRGLWGSGAVTLAVLAQVEHPPTDKLEDFDDAEVPSAGELVEELQAVAEWARQSMALLALRRLAVFRPRHISGSLAEFTPLVTKCVKSPRSSLSRAALMAASNLAPLYSLPPASEGVGDVPGTSLELAVPLVGELLGKAANAKRFLGEIAEASLMSFCASPAHRKVLDLLLLPKVKHNSPKVRAKVAICIEHVLSAMSAEEIGVEEMLPLAATLQSDKDPEARQAAAKMLGRLHTVHAAQKSEVRCIDARLRCPLGKAWCEG
eukprot:scaffold1223_cov380-Prasinococcus_capsulatus_cf.AAC.10